MADSPSKKKITIVNWRWASILLMILIVLAVAVPAFQYYHQKQEARAVLRHGKDVYLAASASSLEEEGLGRSFLAEKEPSGVSAQASQSIRELSQAEGGFRFRRWELGAEGAKEFYYWEGQYMVHFESDADGKQSWNVYKMQAMIQH